MNNPVNRYLLNRIETATPQQLTLMLYDGALKFARLAERALQQGNIRESNRCLQRCQLIVQELMLGINFEAGEIAENLFKIYEYIYHKLVQANIRKDPGLMPEIIRHLTELKDSWEHVVSPNGQ